jgi:GNAT superfamily N-acetyltransferase
MSTLWQSGGMTSVRRAAPSEVDALAGVLGRAFQDDPVAAYTFPDEEGRKRALPKFFGLELRHQYIEDSEVYTNDDLSGAALWSPPGKPRPGLRALVGLLPMVPHLGLRLPRVLRMLTAIESRHPRQAHFYLGVLGTEPALQGRGIGSSLLAPVLSRCDSDGLPAYLESSKERNVPFYARHGFTVSEEVDIGSEGPRLWLMWREPRPGS